MDNNRTKQKIMKCYGEGNSGLCVHDFVHLHTCVCVCASMCVGGSCVRQDEFRERCSISQRRTFLSWIRSVVQQKDKNIPGTLNRV